MCTLTDVTTKMGTRMKWLLIFTFHCCCLSVIECRKEKASILDQLLDDPDLLRKVEKRLGLTNDYDPDESSPAGESENSNNVDGGQPQQQSASSKDSQTSSKNGDDMTISDSEGNTCSYKRRARTIIRSNESRKNGARFIRSQVNNESSCIKSCCYTQGCTLAVFENKVKIVKS